MLTFPSFCELSMCKLKSIFFKIFIMCTDDPLCLDLYYLILLLINRKGFILSPQKRSTKFLKFFLLLLFYFKDSFSGEGVLVFRISDSFSTRFSQAVHCAKTWHYPGFGFVWLGFYIFFFPLKHIFLLNVKDLEHSFHNINDIYWCKLPHIHISMHSKTQIFV